jgi:nucleotide-binding universal stress UspA family protein
MFKNVLVGVDGRPNGRDAVVLAARLTDPAGRLTLAHVHSGELRPSHALAPSVLRGEREASEALLGRERDAAGVDAELLSIVAMGAGRGLHEQAEEREADLLVVGSCSHGTFGRAMLGDDTRAALNGAPCAVAIAARGYAAKPVPLARLGVAYNASQESKGALSMARELAKRSGASVHALEVVSLPAFAYTGLVPPAIGESIDLLLQQANGSLQALADVDGRAVYGVTGEELSSFGDEVDLLIVGSRGYGPLRRLVLGSTSDYLQRHSRCSLLVLPRAADSDDELTAGGELQAESGVASPA